MDAKKMQARGQARRAAILDVTEKELLRVGVDGLTMQAVGQLSGTPPGSLYQYFRSKEDLLRAAVERLEGEVRAIAASGAETHRLAAPARISEAVISFLGPFVSFYENRPAYLVLADAASRALPPDGVESLTDSFVASRLSDILRDYCRQTNVDRLDLVSRTMIEAAHAVLEHALSFGDVRKAAFVSELKDMLAAYAALQVER